jgi:hypothetical protein
VRVVGRYSDYVRTSDDKGEDRTFHFCPECGATVFFTDSTAPDVVGVSVGAFADPSFPAPNRLGVRVTTASVASCACSDGTPRLKATSGDNYAWWPTVRFLSRRHA